jgi:hypothetical protein
VFYMMHYERSILQPGHASRSHGFRFMNKKFYAKYTYVCCQKKKFSVNFLHAYHDL